MNNIRIYVYTEREGVLSSIGHDLKLVVGRFDVDELDDGFAVSVDADSITVAGCLNDGVEGTVSSMDKKVIEKNLNKDVLRSKQYKHIDFEGTLEPDGDGGIIRGKLRMVGKEGDVEVRMEREGNTYRGEAIIDQRDFGIKPYTAFLGALRIKPLVRVEILADA